MKGYKAFDLGYVCRDFQYEIGQTYKHDGEIKICEAGFHFCKNLIDVFSYYNFDRTKVVVAEIEAVGKIEQEGTKYCTDEIKIVKEVSWDEVDKHIENGNNNVGIHNTGDFNSGDFNSGNSNSGDFNTGYRNSGSCNSGDFNSGNCNNGDRNSGDFNSGDFNSGFFNSDTPTVRLFNKDSGMTFKDFFNLGINWENLEKSKKIIQNLPNYDAQIFYECTGIDWR